ncbi:hypothetical protein K456DRAFT_1757826 [Colletotrichum gloeosporioides 23]|nr:hypothetical protein K456DRAFT_1757826 [Colletotrichum gloeosporioides 23]
MDSNTDMRQSPNYKVRDSPDSSSSRTRRALAISANHKKKKAQNNDENDQRSDEDDVGDIDDNCISTDDSDSDSDAQEAEQAEAQAMPIAAEFTPTITVSCSLIHLGSWVMLQGRVCSVTNIQNTAGSDTYVYVGVDVMNEETHVDSSVASDIIRGSITHVMEAPVFKQYPVRYVGQDFVRVSSDADTEMDIRLNELGLAVSLSHFFNSSPDSFRVLALRIENEDVVVAYHLINQPTWTNLAVQPKWDLHELARQDDRDGITAAIQQHSNINALDSQNRSALFVAIQSNNATAAQLLWNLPEATLNMASHDEESSLATTALGLAVEKGKFDVQMADVARGLLFRGASPVVNVDPEIVKLLVAASQGNLSTVSQLLGSDNSHPKVEINGTDLLGYTALHEAAHSGHYDIVKLLMEYGSDINAVVDLGGDGVLHTVVKSRDHRTCLEPERQMRHYRPLSENHVMVMELLLRKGASVEYKRPKDKKTAQDMVLERLRHGGLRKKERVNLQQMLMIMKPFSKGKNPVEPQPNDMIFSDEVYVQLHTRPHKDTKPEKGGKVETSKPEKEGKVETSDSIVRIFKDIELFNTVPSDGGWRRIHLSENNRSSVEHAVDSLRALPTHGALAAHTAGVKIFIDDAFDEIETPPHHPGMRKPAFYSFDQFCRGPFSLVVPKESEKNILVVNQMWIWKIDCETVITTIPEDSHDHGNYDERDDDRKGLFNSLANALRRESPSSVDAAICRMLLCVIESADAPTYSGFSEEMLDIYDQSIARHKQDEAMCYRNFFMAQREDERKRHTRNEEDEWKTRRRPDEDEMCKIFNETMMLQEVKDIKDELKMIERVIYDQSISNRPGPQTNRRCEDTRSISLLARQINDKRTGNGRRSYSSFSPLSRSYSRDFPSDGQGDVAWTQRQVFSANATTLIITLAIIAIIWIGQRLYTRRAKEDPLNPEHTVGTGYIQRRIQGDANTLPHFRLKEGDGSLWSRTVRKLTSKPKQKERDMA